MNEEKPIEQQVTRGLNTPSVQPTKKSFPFPTEIITLPSKGLVYPENSPLANGEITIKLMTAKEEDILTSTTLIKKGIQLDKLFESLVVEPGVNPNDIVTGDKNAILVSSRILAFGPEYSVTINDPEENEPVDVTIDLSKIKIKEIDETILNRQNEFDFVLPVSKTPVKFKLLTHGDEVAISKDVDASQKTIKQRNEITSRWRRILVEINGNRDIGYISNFVANQLLAGDSKALRKYISSVNPDLDLTFDYTSPVTGETEALKIPFGIDFFYPSE